MHGLFNYDGFVVQTANKITDCICLSILWLVSSLPIFTVGAANTALYYATNKCIRRGDGGVWKTYWSSFRSNFRQATLLWLVLFLGYALLSASCVCAYLMCSAGNLPKELLYLPAAATAVFTAWGSLPFPYLARFRNDNRTAAKNCLGIALMNLPVTLLQLVFLVLAIVGILVFPLAILCAPGIYMVLSCYSLEPVFRKYMPEADRAREEALDKE